MNLKPTILTILILTSGIFYYQITGDAIFKTENVIVQRVIDGDTLELQNGQKVRLLGINTPEKSMTLSFEATNFLKNLAENKTLRLESQGIDKYGRTLAYLFTNNQNINRLILQEGLGTLYYYEKDKHYKELKQAEEFARLNKKGLWEKSPNENCIKIVELKTNEPEKLTLQNNCDKNIPIMFKDDATHIYQETLRPNSIFTKESSHIWNDEGDSLYVWDSEGLLVFYRY